MKKIVAWVLLLAMLLACTGCGGGGTPLFEKMGKETKAWADAFDEANPPALTIYRETNGYAEEPKKITSPETVVSIFKALSQITVSATAEAKEEAPVDTFTFASQNGSKQNFVLREDDCVIIGKTAYQAEGVSQALSAAGILSSPGKEEPSASASAGGEEAQIFSSQEMNFSFLYSAAYEAQLGDGGKAVVHLAGQKDLPYFEVLHLENGPDAKEYLEEQRFSAQMEYGNALLEDGGAPTKTGAEERNVYAISYVYQDASGTTVEKGIFAEDLSVGNVAVYVVTCAKDDSDAILPGLNQAIQTFQPQAGYYQGGGGATPAPSQAPAGYELQAYDGGIFTMQLPKGWKIETGGEYAGFSFRAYDPNDPDVQIFYYGELGPYFKSNAGKNAYRQMSGGRDANSNLPVLDPPTLENCLTGLDEYEKIYQSIMGKSYDFADIHHLSNVSEKPIQTFLASYAQSESMLMGELVSKTGAPCLGIFQGTIVDAGSYALDGVDIAPGRGAMNVFGIIAPKEKFAGAYASLAQSLSSFRFTEEYIQEGIHHTNLIGQSALEYSRQNAAMMDRITNDFLDYINDRITIYI